MDLLCAGVAVARCGRWEDMSELGFSSSPCGVRPKGLGGPGAPTYGPRVCVQDMWVPVFKSERLCQQPSCPCWRHCHSLRTTQGGSHLHSPHFTEKNTEVHRGEVDQLERAQPRHKPRTVLLSPSAFLCLVFCVSLGVHGP